MILCTYLLLSKTTNMMISEYWWHYHQNAKLNHYSYYTHVSIQYSFTELFVPLFQNCKSKHHSMLCQSLFKLTTNSLEGQLINIIIIFFNWKYCIFVSFIVKNFKTKINIKLSFKTSMYKKNEMKNFAIYYFNSSWLCYQLRHGLFIYFIRNLESHWHCPTVDFRQWTIYLKSLWLCKWYG